MSGISYMVDTPKGLFEDIGLQANRNYKGVQALVKRKDGKGLRWHQVIKTTKKFVIISDPEVLSSGTRRVSPAKVKRVKARVGSEIVYFGG